MSETPDRRHYDRELVEAVNGLSQQVGEVREKQERQLAVSIALQEHKTIERVDVIWETMAEWRSAWSTLKTLLHIGLRLFTWGCATTLLAVGLIIAWLNANGGHWRWP